MQPILVTATAEKVTFEESGSETPVVIDDGLPPPTHAQIAYWRELCGALSLVKGRGMADDAWPADLAPSKPTLKAMAERNLIVRRQRAWLPQARLVRQNCGPARSGRTNPTPIPRRATTSGPAQLR